MNDVLAVSGLEARHGLLQAVRGVSFSVAKGELIAFVGANGAGKTTLFRAVAGAHRPSAGSILFQGTDITPLPDHERVRRGIVLVPEGRRLFARLSVLENLTLAGAVGRPGKWNLETVLQVFPNLGARLKSKAGNLSGGEQQATAIGRALMTNPDVLLLDEISLGLSPAAVGRVYDSLLALTESGTAILLVEQDLNRALSVADRVICMLEGTFVAEGRARDMTREQIANAYFGLHRAAMPRGRMMDWINSIIQGVLLGGYYALLACGLAFMFQVMGIINLAHGTLAVTAGFMIWVICDHWGMNPFMALIGVLPLMASVGWVLQRAILERSARAGQLVPLLATFGLAIAIENLLFEGFGADTRSLAPYIDTPAYDSWTIGEIHLGQLSVLVFGVAVALLGGLSLFLSSTRLGCAIRATAEDPDTVGLIGIDARKVNAAATCMAMVAVAIAGMFLGMRSTFTPYSGSAQLVFAFEAAAIGGSGSLWGTLVGGVVLGVAQTIGAQINPQGFLIGGHLVFLVILVVRVSAVMPAVGVWAGRLERTTK
jgi:branched-chain amino acid transport system permease protein